MPITLPLGESVFTLMPFSVSQVPFLKTPSVHTRNCQLSKDGFGRALSARTLAGISSSQTAPISFDVPPQTARPSLQAAHSSDPPPQTTQASPQTARSVPGVSIRIRARQYVTLRRHHCLTAPTNMPTKLPHYVRRIESLKDLNPLTRRGGTDLSYVMPMRKSWSRKQDAAPKMAWKPEPPSSPAPVPPPANLGWNLAQTPDPLTGNQFQGSLRSRNTSLSGEVVFLGGCGAQWQKRSPNQAAEPLDLSATGTGVKAGYLQQTLSSLYDFGSFNLDDNSTNRAFSKEHKQSPTIRLSEGQEIKPGPWESQPPSPKGPNPKSSRGRYGSFSEGDSTLVSVEIKEAINQAAFSASSQKEVR